jgi:amino acid adenylation domain-containing protein
MLQKTSRVFLEEPRKVSKNTIANLCRHTTGTSIAAVIVLSQVKINRTDVPMSYLPNSVGEAFDRVAAANGSKILLSCAGKELTYAEARKRSGQLANQLRRHRLRQNEAIGISSNDTALVLIACLGIMKAGYAYVSLDPALPDRRMKTMMEIADLRLCVTDTERISRIDRLGVGAHPIDRPDFPPEFPDDTSDVIVPPDSLAHILFTSGSTGIPKAVPRKHFQVLHNIFRHRDLRIGPDDRMTLITKNGFFESVSNPYTAFLNGATLCGISLMTEGITEFSSWIRREKITVYYSFPTIFRQLAATAPSKADMELIRLLYLGGEAVEPSDLRTCKMLLRDDAEIAIGLNSTETGLTLLNLFPVAAIDDDTNTSLGTPVAGINVELHDESGRVCENGFGEIIIRSPYIFSGYLNGSPDTQSRIYEDEAAPGTFVFRTGDLARVDEAGRYSILGRIGQQIKLRGYRIELGEIESAFRSLETITDACAVVVGESSNAEELAIAIFVVGCQGRALNTSELRHRVSEFLPTHMVPAFILAVDQLPQTSNGKIDRQALSLRLQRPELSSAPAMAHSTELEGVVADSWRDLLRVEKILPESNFFDLGGNSIKALRHIAWLRARSKQKIPIRLLFEKPTFGAFCETLSKDFPLEKIQDAKP